MKAAIATLLKIVLMILVIPVALVASLIGSKSKASVSDVASCLRRFIDGTGSEWEWDDFTSVSIADPQLENIRCRADAVKLPVTEEGLETLKSLLAEAERLLISRT